MKEDDISRLFVSLKSNVPQAERQNTHFLGKQSCCNVASTHERTPLKVSSPKNGLTLMSPSIGLVQHRCLTTSELLFPYSQSGFDSKKAQKTH